MQSLGGFEDNGLLRRRLLACRCSRIRENSASPKPNSHVFGYMSGGGLGVLAVHNLVKEYDGKPALRGVSFTVRPGEITGYLGPNGAGKSTTVKAIVGLLQPTQGHIEVDGIDVQQDPVQAKMRIGYAPENGALYGTLSAQEFLWLVAELHHVERGVGEERIGQMLAAFGLADLSQRQLETLSRGQRQKVLLIAALLHDPDVILLDEPLQGLDANAVRAFRQILEQLATRGKTILFCSHILDVVERLCPRVIVLHQGSIVANDSTKHLLEQAPRGTLENVFQQLTKGDEVEDGVREFLAAFDKPKTTPASTHVRAKKP